MKIEFEKFPKRWLEEAQNYLEFCAETLIGRRLSKNLNVFVEGSTVLKKNEGRVAECDWLDKGVRSRDFEINVDVTVSKRDLFIALGHELIHVKQYAKGELRDRWNTSGDVKYWFGRPVLCTDNNYLGRPWEKEAFSKDEKLFDEWCKMCNISHYKWTKDRQ